MTPQALEKSLQSGRDDVYGLSPVQLVLKAYGIGIEGCGEADPNKVSKALVELISALNFEYRDVAMGMFRLYDYCLRRIKAGDFEAVQSILEELRQTWSKVEKNQGRRAG